MENTKTGFYDALESQEFLEFEGCIPFILGKKEDGSIAVEDMAGLPHLVVAGATGTGKSTLVHGILSSMIRQAAPDTLRLILCDTKMLEFQCYRRIPHLLVPIQTKLNEIEGTIMWANMEMARRLADFIRLECRSVEQYNEIARNKRMTEIPYLVMVLDDAAIVMDEPEIKQGVDDLVHKGHLVGIHLILITQVPALKQISDTIKKSIPVRAVFNVLSNEEEKLLLGIQKNEMVSNVGEIVFCDLSQNSRKKIKCFNISYDDVEKICASVIDMYHTFMDDYKKKKLDEAAAVVAKNSDMDDNPSSEELYDDELFPEAVDVVLETGQASVPMLQGRLKISCARAFTLIDAMEKMGIVGPFMGSKPRAILITKEKWKALRTGDSDDSWDEDDDTDEEYASVEIPVNESSAEPPEEIAVPEEEPRKNKKAAAAFLLLGAAMIAVGFFANPINPHVKLMLILWGFGIIIITILK